MRRRNWPSRSPRTSWRAERSAELKAFVDALPPDVRDNERIILARAVVAANDGQFDELERLLFSRQFATIREGETLALRSLGQAAAGAAGSHAGPRGDAGGTEAGSRGPPDAAHAGPAHARPRGRRPRPSAARALRSSTDAVIGREHRLIDGDPDGAHARGRLRRPTPSAARRMSGVVPCRSHDLGDLRRHAGEMRHHAAAQHDRARHLRHRTRSRSR